ncbi:DUF397 domain-containing protein [Streptomyces sp. GC420]|uniref:DUF397 domain-containing protein n=1 Tax=Streptomyces sp. GC420 TaxID=2697568 RepID=UPI001414F511|nr:DUF397 domain-containing protein [Streptomyces sp. GC420]NBM19020.1 DUF397 domain-containing protein [Streptomyces sp. GC420]
MSTPELDWFKSSYSSAQGDDCVEVAVTEQAVHVRDSKDVTQVPFSVGPDSWAHFLAFAAKV